jgi:hypothetical protein
MLILIVNGFALQMDIIRNSDAKRRKKIKNPALLDEERRDDPARSDVLFWLPISLMNFSLFSSSRALSIERNVPNKKIQLFFHRFFIFSMLTMFRLV